MTRAICIGSRVGIASAAQTAKAAGADAMLISQGAAAFGLVTRDLVLMARHYSAILRRHATPLGFEVWNGPVALQVR